MLYFIEVVFGIGTGNIEIDQRKLFRILNYGSLIGFLYPYYHVYFYLKWNTHT